LADEFIDLKYALKPQYHQRARWLLHRDVLKVLRKLKTADGDYLWSRGLAMDRPDTILEVPYLLSEYAPNTLTTGKYVALLGDLSFYWIADSLEMTIQVLLEKYALTNETGYIANMEVDAMPVLADAFVRLKLA
jgi:HK97 family phage major capsid protein